MKHYIYLAIVGGLFLGLTLVLNLLPRSSVSELEKRELATFPTFSWQRLTDGTFTRDVAAWFSDTEPFRDQFMLLSMHIKDMERIVLGDDDIRFHASDNPASSDQTPDDFDSAGAGSSAADSLNADENAKIANAGIIVVGSGQNVRALMAYGGTPGGPAAYAKAANKYQEVFGSDVQVYFMLIPTAIEFYCPEKVSKRTKSQRAVIDYEHSRLSQGVKAVDVHAALARHTGEDIYLRTDHHWAPLGGYYAAQEFARVAGVPFRDLTAYSRHVVHGYVGSMYGYSGDIAVKEAPEDFVYYVPNGVSYETTYINYNINKDYQVTSEGHPYKGQFFFHYSDGHGGAYCTMMGGDCKITQVRTGTHNGRRVIILKDSFGNMLPGYLFYSFEEVHVIDFRYFTRDIVNYVAQHHITDILFANNVFSAFSPSTANKYLRFIHQKWAPPVRKEGNESSDSTKASTDSAATAAPAQTVVAAEAAAQPAQSAAPSDTTATER